MFTLAIVPQLSLKAQLDSAEVKIKIEIIYYYYLKPYHNEFIIKTMLTHQVIDNFSYDVIDTVFSNEFHWRILDKFQTSTFNRFVDIL